VRSLSGESAQPLNGTAGAAHPFWSPDGRYIGFFAGGKLMKIAAAGGPAVTITDVPNSRGGSWSANHWIVFAPSFDGALLKVNVQGGATAPATVLDKTSTPLIAGPGFSPMANTSFSSPPVTPEEIPNRTESTSGRSTARRLTW